MKKYDCNKTLDYAHELKRLCATVGCCECPMSEMPFCKDVTALSQENIDFVQKWSDEHPEVPKLRKRELDFIAMFKWPDKKWIRRGWDGCLHITLDEGRKYSLCDSWFSFIERGESMAFEKLLELEVEE